MQHNLLCLFFGYMCGKRHLPRKGNIELKFFEFVKWFIVSFFPSVMLCCLLYIFLYVHSVLAPL